MADIPIPFGRILHAGDHGQDVFAVTRTLAREGYGDLADAKHELNAPMVRWLKAFQKKNGLDIDGVYGRRSHAKLAPLMDDYSFLLYTGKPPHPPPPHIILPSVFTPTHETKGLPGYPAIDVFGPAGATVGAPAEGTIRRLSGHDPAQGGIPGEAYGWSIYLAVPHADFYLTHFGSRNVRLGQKVKRGDILGTICDARVAHMASSLSHIHEGKNSL